GAFQRLSVQVSDSSSSLVPCVQLSQLDSSDGSVYRVKSRCVANPRHSIFRRSTAVSETTSLISNILIIRHNHPAVTADRHVLAGVERETCNVSERADSSSFVLRAVCLTSVLNDANFFIFGEVPKFVHPRRLSVKMNWNDDAGFRRELRFNFCRIEVEPIVFHVSKSWLSPCVDYCVGCGEEREWGSHDFIVRTDLHRLKRDLKGGGTGPG